jgi:hypothetical protein
MEIVNKWPTHRHGYVLGVVRAYVIGGLSLYLACVESPDFWATVENINHSVLYLRQASVPTFNRNQPSLLNRPLSKPGGK